MFWIQSKIYSICHFTLIITRYFIRCWCCIIKFHCIFLSKCTDKFYVRCNIFQYDVIRYFYRDYSVLIIYNSIPDLTRNFKRRNTYLCIVCTIKCILWHRINFWISVIYCTVFIYTNPLISGICIQIQLTVFVCTCFYFLFCTCIIIRNKWVFNILLICYSVNRCFYQILIILSCRNCSGIIKRIKWWVIIWCCSESCVYTSAINCNSAVRSLISTVTDAVTWAVTDSFNITAVYNDISALAACSRCTACTASDTCRITFRIIIGICINITAVYKYVDTRTVLTASDTGTAISAISIYSTAVYSKLLHISDTGTVCRLKCYNTVIITRIFNNKFWSSRYTSYRRKIYRLWLNFICAFQSKGQLNIVTYRQCIVYRWTR